MVDVDEEQGGFWPGYVSAMVSLAQSLLLVIGILAGTILTYSMLLQDRAAQEVTPRTEPTKQVEEEAPATPMDDRAASVAPDEKPTPAAEPPADRAVETRPSSPPRANEARAIAAPGPPVSPAQPPARMIIRFRSDALRIPAEAGREIRTFATSLKAQGAGRIRLSVELDESDHPLMRVAYLRIMSVRNELLAAGIPGPSIETRLVGKTAAATTRDDMNVEISGAERPAFVGATHGG